MQAALLGQVAKFARADQQSSGKDIGLDEVGARRIGIEQFIAHRDILDSGSPARFQVAGDTIHEGRPVLAAERFDHFDTDDGIKLALCVAVILFAEIDRFVLVIPRPRQLFIGQADRRHPTAARGDVIGERAPSTSDFQHGFRVANPLGKRSPLAALSLCQILRSAEQRR